MTNLRNAIRATVLDAMAGENQAAFAARIGVGQATVSKWLRGRSFGSDTLLIWEERYPDHAQRIKELLRQQRQGGNDRQEREPAPIAREVHAD